MSNKNLQKSRLLINVSNKDLPISRRPWCLCLVRIYRCQIYDNLTLSLIVELQMSNTPPPRKTPVTTENYLAIILIEDHNETIPSLSQLVKLGGKH